MSFSLERSGPVYGSASAPGLAGNESYAAVVRSVDAAVVEEVDTCVRGSHREVLCGEVISSISDEDAVAGFCEVFCTDPAAAAGADDYDVGVEDLLIIPGRELQEFIIEILAWFPVDGGPGEAEDGVESCALFDPCCGAETGEAFDYLPQGREVGLLPAL